MNRFACPPALFTRSLPRSRPFAGSSAFNLSVAQRYRDICLFFYLRCDKPGLVVANVCPRESTLENIPVGCFRDFFSPSLSFNYRQTMVSALLPRPHPSKELISSQEFLPRPRRIELNFFFFLSSFPLHTLIKNLKDVGRKYRPEYLETRILPRDTVDNGRFD